MENQNISEILLESIRYAVNKRIGGVQLRRMKVDAWRSEMADELVVSLSGYLLAEPLTEETHTTTVRYPATWWQHVKRDLFPATLARWLDVKYATKSDTVRFEQKALYPKLPQHTCEAEDYRMITIKHFAN